MCLPKFQPQYTLSNKAIVKKHHWKNSYFNSYKSVGTSHLLDLDLKRADVSLGVFDYTKGFIFMRQNLLNKAFWKRFTLEIWRKWLQTITWLHKLYKNNIYQNLSWLSSTLKRFLFSILYRWTRLNYIICVLSIHLW